MRLDSKDPERERTKMIHETELIIDLFAGGGGASTGIEAALGRPVNFAVNHSAVAIAVHAANHSKTEHFIKDVFEVKPEEVTKGRPVGLLWASPDCTHFSVAKGDVPRNQGIRSLAWVVVEWAKSVQPRVICLENVREFQGWGPLGSDGRPDKAKTGETFKEWVSALKLCGYSVDWRILDASEFGAPTKRRRLFVVARGDGIPIAWPESTHGPGKLPVRTAAECIDWSIPCPSIFGRKKPLAEKTLARIAEGIKRFVIENPSPFIIGNQQGIDNSKDVAAFITKHFSGVYGHELTKPIGTVTAIDHHSLTVACLAKFRGTGKNQPMSCSVEQPLPTISAGGIHVAEVRAFLTLYYGCESSGQSLNSPLRTVTSKDRLGLVTVAGHEYQITDIGMRMLDPSELLKAQFGPFADSYDLSAAKTKTAKVRLIGNSVCPQVAEALVSAQFGPQAIEIKEAA
jgi:DNA (cytosine-5)-methyltransferase 1